MTQLLRAIFEGQRREAARLASPSVFFVEIGCGFARQGFYLQRKENALVLCELSEGITWAEAIITRSDIVVVL